MSKSVARTALPTSYVVPKVWRRKTAPGASPLWLNDSAASRSEVTLPQGAHRFQLYSLGTPNGVKVTWMFEELLDEFRSKSSAEAATGKSLDDVEYDAFKINISQADQFSSGFTAINPNQKIPALVDKKTGLNVFESANICVYVCQQVGTKLLPPVTSDVAKHTQIMNWVFWLQGVAPYLGNFGHFYNYAPIDIEYGIDRFAAEFRRVLDVLERQLARENGGYVVGDSLTLADVVIAPWISAVDYYKNASNGIGAREFLNIEEDYPLVVDWLLRMQARPAFQRGKRVNGFGDDAIAERHSDSDFLQ